MLLSKKIKVITSSGQISLGQKYAGRNIMVHEFDDGRWIITSNFIVKSDDGKLECEADISDMTTDCSQVKV